MRAGLAFLLLLESIFVVLGSQNVQAAPAKRGAGMVTLALKRVPQKRGDIHPYIYLQQHVNRGHRRLARMIGSAEPTDEELRSHIHKRIVLVEQEAHKKPHYRHQRNIDASATIPAEGSVGTSIAVGGVASLRNGTSCAATQISGAPSAAGSSNATGLPPIVVAALRNPSLITVASSPAAANSLGLSIEANNVGYIATVEMGTPPRSFQLVMDSGSADLWVGNAQNCHSKTGGGCGNHTFLGSSTSSTFVDTNEPFNVTYGGGGVEGTICMDNIVLAGLHLDQHIFGTAQQESPMFTSDQVPFDGLMGLAQFSLSKQHVLTPVESLARHGLINDAITSFKISRLSDQNNDGEITFGGLDPTKFQVNTLTTFDNVNTRGYWGGLISAATVNGQDTGLQNRVALLDTGTSLIQIPPGDAAAIHQLIPGAQSVGDGVYTIPCTTNASVALTFGNTAFTVEPQDLTFMPVDYDDPTGDCMSSIAAMSNSSTVNTGGSNEWLVGDVFLKNAYFSTDEGKNQISLAKLW